MPPLEMNISQQTAATDHHDIQGLQSIAPKKQSALGRTVHRIAVAQGIAGQIAP